MKTFFRFILRYAWFAASSMVAQAQVPLGSLTNDQITGDPLTSSDQSAVVLIHGWNPGGETDPFAQDDWAQLSNALRGQLGGSVWKLLHYNWAQAANTGGIDLNGFTHATEAANRAFSQGNHLANLLQSGGPNLRKVLFIAHSAGSWAAYRAVWQLLGNNPNVTVELVLLDPFVPGVAPAQSTTLTTELMSQLAGHTSSNRILRMENYYAVDVGTDIDWVQDGADHATSQRFAWRGQDVNQRIDYLSGVSWRYADHSGPIRFYADSVAAFGGTYSGAFAGAPYASSNYGFFLALPSADSTQSGPLRVALTASKNEVEAGYALVYTATVVNTSSAPMSGVSLQILAPTGINTIRPFAASPDPDSSSLPYGGYWYGGNTARWTIGTLTAGASWTTRFRVVTDSSSAGSGTILRCTALAQNAAGQQTTAALDTRVGSGLRLQLRSLPREVAPGNELHIRAIYSNQLSRAAEQATLDLELPPGFVVTGATEGATQDGNVLSWELGTVAVGHGGQIEVVATAPATTGSGAIFISRGGFSEQFGGRATATESIVVRPDNKLRVTLSRPASPVSDGGSLLYTATVVNVSPNPVSGASLQILAPIEVETIYPSAASPAPDSSSLSYGNYWYGGDTATWSIGTLNAGASWTVRFTVTTDTDWVANGTILRCSALALSSAGQEATAHTDILVGTTFRQDPLGVPTVATRVIGVSGNLFFGPIVQNQSFQRAFTISNTGNQPLHVIEIAYPAGFSGNWAGGTIAAGQSQNVMLTFSPIALQSYGGTINIISDATAGTGSISASGSGVAATRVIGVSGNLTFGNQTAGTVSGARPMTITNTGNSSLTVNSILYPTCFVGNWASGVIQPGESKVVDVTFAPNAVQSYGGTITINSNATSGLSGIDVSGVGTPAVPEIVIEQPTGTGLIDGTASISFGSLNLGNAGVPVAVTIRNTGTANLAGISVSKDGVNAADFSINQSGMANVLAPGASTSFTVTFAPSTAGSKVAALRVASNDTDENPFDLSLSGNGVAIPEISVESDGWALVDGMAQVNFGVFTGGSLPTKIFTIRNPGSANLEAIALTLNGPNAGDYVIDASTMASFLSPGATTTFTVAFRPGTSGTKLAAVHIASNDADESSFDIGLTGSAGPLPDIRVDQPKGYPVASGGTKGFGTVLLRKKATLTFTVTNTGNANLTGTTVGLSSQNAGDFKVTANLAAPIKPGKSKTFKVQFAPLSSGPKSAVLRIASNDPDENPYVINLTGMAQ